ncbi:TPA: transposase [Yersinia enterocolitica]
MSKQDLIASQIIEILNSKNKPAYKIYFKQAGDIVIDFSKDISFIFIDTENIVMDLCSRKIVSWAFSDKPDSVLAIRALRLAVNKRQPTRPLVFHSDQGAQYTSAQFQYCQNELGVTGSMSRKGNCLDNAVTERFFRSLKAGRVNYRRYETRSQGNADVINYIDSFYNLKRRHYRLGNISPDEYEHRLRQCA